MGTLKLFDAELTAMEYLWEKGPVTAAQMSEDMLEQYGWKKSTTYIVLKRLENKGAVCRKEPKYRVVPLISRRQVQQTETDSLLARMFGGSFTRLFANFLDSNGVSEDTLEELQALIDEKKKEK